MPAEPRERTSGAVEAILASPVGRRAVEAACAPFTPTDHHRDDVRETIQAALDVLLSDVCSTCQAKFFRVRCTNPDCDNGKVKPALPTWERTEQLVTAARKASVEAADLMREEYRAEAIEEVKGWLREGDDVDRPGNSQHGRHTYPSGGGYKWELAADYIERREREKN